jgi:hypothetical protein
MNPVLWSKLPSELLELTLAFLPVPALCRFRTVCKTWNALISNLKYKRKSYEDFIVLCESKGSNILDLREWRWYTIKDTEYQLFGPTIRYKHVVAIDKELVCQIWYYTDIKLYVCDILTGTYTRLPSCAAINGTIKPVINLVKTGCESYKLSYIPGGVTTTARPFMVIYESTTSKWRFSSPLPMKFHYGALCSVFFDKLLYVLMSPSATTLNSDSVCLWSYDYVRDEWKNTNVTIPDMRSVCHPAQLLVIGARLFLASWMQKLDPNVKDPESDISYRTWPGVRHSWRYVLSEIDLQERSCTRMFEMTEPDMRKLLNVRFSETCQHRDYQPEHINAVGCCNAIVLICVSTGMSIVYDLRDSSWKVVPYQPRGQKVHAYRFGAPVKLVLPVHTLWFTGMD